MKKFWIFITVLSCISVQLNAQQQAPHQLFIGGYLGPQMYTTYGGGSSFHFGVEIGNYATKDVALVGNVGAVLEKNTKNYDITLNARAFAMSGPTVQLFGELGGGAYIFTASNYYSGTKSQTYLGINIGLGGKIEMDKSTDLIIKAKFHNPFFSGGSFNWINLTAGINFKI